MDLEMLSRIQFAFTIMFHYIYPPLSIGLGVMMVLMEGRYLWTKDPLYLTMAKFWTRIFALTFAMGVATGIVMEFEFGTNWAAYSRYVGDVFGSALAAEGVFAFFLESGFLALLLFGWDRLSPGMHFFSTLMVCLGAHFSAVWIVVANSWMQTPAGFKVVGEGLSARAEITDFWEMVFNPSSVDRLIHVLLGCWLAGIFLVMSVSAYYLLKERFLRLAEKGLKMAIVMALITTLLQLFSGDRSGKIVAEYQKPKLAALEGVFETEKGAPLILAGIVNKKEKRVDYSLKIPKLLSFLSYGDFDAEVKGLDQVIPQDWPNVSLTFQTYRLMIYMWTVMFFLSVSGALFWWKGTLLKKKWLLRFMVFGALAPQIANQAGWMSAEVGRYPWIVTNLLRISEGLSKSVTAGQVMGSIIMFGVIYILLFILFVYLLDQKIRHGPEEKKEEDTSYPKLESLLK